MNEKRIIGPLVLTLALMGFSCAHENAVKKETTIKPVEHEKMLQEFQKGVEESRKIAVARVNGVDIMLDKLLGMMNQIAPNYIAHGQRTPEIDEKVRVDALDILIFRELVIQEAVRRGMKVTPEQIDETLKKIKANTGTEDEFNKFLSTTGETEESLRKEIEKNRLFDMIAKEEIFHKAKEDADAQSFELRKREWEAELKKDAKIELLPAAKRKDEADKPGNE